MADPASSARAFETEDAPGTEDLGAALGGALPAGAVVALEGELGAGKTCFVRGVARGLGCVDDVASPTYTLMHEYAGRLTVRHFDAWMTTRETAFLEDGGADCFHDDGVALVEWAERVEDWLPRPRLQVRLEPLDAHRRRITIALLGPAPEAPPASRALAEALANCLAALEAPAGVSESQGPLR